MFCRDACPDRPSGVYVMLPLDTVSADGVFRYGSTPWFSRCLSVLAMTGVDGVAVDVWWSAVEREQRIYNWSGYRQLFELVKQSGLKMQVVLSFHACGGNVGDTIQMPLPGWVLQCGDSDPDLFFTDRPRGTSGLGQRNREYLSIWADDSSGVLCGRSPMQCYEDFMVSFKGTFEQDLGAFVEDIVIGSGPCGELRFPSYVEANGWKFPGVGEFQCYDRRALASLAQAAREAGHPEWGYTGPHDAGTYNSLPEECGFFASQGSWDSPYGRFFLSWYSNSLIRHGDRLLEVASSVFASNIQARQPLSPFYTPALGPTSPTIGSTSDTSLETVLNLAQESAPETSVTNPTLINSHNVSEATDPQLQQQPVHSRFLDQSQCQQQHQAHCPASPQQQEQQQQQQAEVMRVDSTERLQSDSRDLRSLMMDVEQLCHNGSSTPIGASGSPTIKPPQSPGLQQGPSCGLQHPRFASTHPPRLQTSEENLFSHPLSYSHAQQLQQPLHTQQPQEQLQQFQGYSNFHEQRLAAGSAASSSALVSDSIEQAPSHTTLPSPHGPFRAPTLNMFSGSSTSFADAEACGFSAVETERGYTNASSPVLAAGLRYAMHSNGADRGDDSIGFSSVSGEAEDMFSLAAVPASRRGATASGFEYEYDEPSQRRSIESFGSNPALSTISATTTRCLVASTWAPVGSAVGLLHTSSSSGFGYAHHVPAPLRQPILPAPNSIVGSPMSSSAGGQLSSGDGRGSLHLTMKIPGIHWWFRSNSHAAELTAGYYNTVNRDGYTALIDMCARHGVQVTLTCVEMCNAQHPAVAMCGPEGLLRQIRVLAARAGVELNGENALPIFLPHCVDTVALDRVVANTRAGPKNGSRGSSVSQATYLHVPILGTAFSSSIKRSPRMSASHSAGATVGLGQWSSVGSGEGSTLGASCAPIACPFSTHSEAGPDSSRHSRHSANSNLIHSQSLQQLPRLSKGGNSSDSLKLERLSSNSVHTALGTAEAAAAELALSRRGVTLPALRIFTFLRLGPELMQPMYQKAWTRFMQNMVSTTQRVS